MSLAIFIMWLTGTVLGIAALILRLRADRRDHLHRQILETFE